MLVSRSNRSEFTGTCFAFVSRPVVGGVHVLLHSSMCAESTITGLAFGPMAIIVHVFIAVFLVVILIVTACAFKHLGR